MRTTEKETPFFGSSLPAACYPPQTAEHVYANLLNTDAPDAHLERLHEIFIQWLEGVPTITREQRISALFTYTTLRQFLLNEQCCPSVSMVSDLAPPGNPHLQTFTDMFTAAMVYTMLGAGSKEQLHQTYLALRQALEDAAVVNQQMQAA